MRFFDLTWKPGTRFPGHQGTLATRVVVKPPRHGCRIGSVPNRDVGDPLSGPWFPGFCTPGFQGSRVAQFFLSLDSRVQGIPLPGFQGIVPLASKA